MWANIHVNKYSQHVNKYSQHVNKYTWHGLLPHTKPVYSWPTFSIV